MIEMFDFLLIRIIQWRSHVQSWGIHPLSLCCCAWLVFFWVFRFSPEPFSGTRPDPFLILARTLFGTHPDSTLFSVLARTLLKYLLGPFSSTCSDPFSVLTRIRFLLQYSPGYDPFCLGFSGTRPNLIPHLSRILWYILGYDLFSGIVLGFPWALRYSPGLDPFSFSLLWPRVQIWIPLAFSDIMPTFPSPFGQHDSFPLAFFIVVWGPNCWSFEFFTRVHFTHSLFAHHTRVSLVHSLY